MKGINFFNMQKKDLRKKCNYNINAMLMIIIMTIALLATYAANLLHGIAFVVLQLSRLKAKTACSL